MSEAPTEQAHEAPEVTTEATETQEPTQDEPQTFSADYVQELRDETKTHREKQQAWATRLHTELVRATGRLADPNDLVFKNSHLDEQGNPTEAFHAAIDELIARKPHYALRPQGNVGQGVKSDAPVSIVAQLKKLV